MVPCHTQPSLLNYIPVEVEDRLPEVPDRLAKLCRAAGRVLRVSFYCVEEEWRAGTQHRWQDAELRPKRGNSTGREVQEHITTHAPFGPCARSAWRGKAGREAHMVGRGCLPH